MADGSFECRVSGRRESANGIFLTLQINPADLTADLAMLRVGSALMVGWSQVLDVAVHPIEPIGSPEHKAKQSTLNKSFSALLDANKPRTPFKDLKLSQQCGIRCGDEQFSLFLMDVFPRTAAKYTDPADVVRSVCCVESRKQFDTQGSAALEWERLEESYQNRLVTMKYKDSYR